MPVIVLKKSTPKEAVCTVFEKVNTGGVPLNVFELLTVTFAGDKILPGLRPAVTDGTDGSDSAVAHSPGLNHDGAAQQHQ